MLAWEILWIVFGVACIAAALVRAAIWRRSGRPVSACIAVLLGGLAVAMLLNPRGIGEWVSTHLGWPNASAAVTQVALIVVAGAGLGIARAAGGRSLRGVIPLTVVVTAASVASFAAAGKLDEFNRDLLLAAPRPWIAVSAMIVVVWAGAVGIGVLTVIVPNAGADTVEKRGMSVLVAGVAAMVVYLGVRLAGLSVLLSGDASTASSVLSADAVVALVGAPLVVLGCVYAHIERWAIALRDLPALRRAYRRVIGTPPITWHVVRDADEMTAQLRDQVAVGADPECGSEVRSWILSRPQRQ